MSTGTTTNDREAASPVEQLVGRRIVSLSSCGVANTQQTQCQAILFALCSDGSVWMTDNCKLGDRWEPVSGVPRGDSVSDRDRDTIREALEHRRLSSGSASHQLELMDLLRRI